VLYADSGGAWRIQCVSVSESSFDNRLSLPEPWYFLLLLLLLVLLLVLYFHLLLLLRLLLLLLLMMLLLLSPGNAGFWSVLIGVSVVIGSAFISAKKVREEMIYRTIIDKVKS